MANKNEPEPNFWLKRKDSDDVFGRRRAVLYRRVLVHQGGPRPGGSY
jgi:hypothetical protein